MFEEVIRLKETGQCFKIVKRPGEACEGCAFQGISTLCQETPDDCQIYSGVIWQEINEKDEYDY